MLMPLIVAVAEFPARSKHVALTDWLALSPDTTIGSGGLPAATPERLSAHWNLACTFVVFQPYALGPCVRYPVIVGGVLSNLMTIVLELSALPALSVAKNVTVVLPSALMEKEVEAPGTTVFEIVWAPLA